MEQNKRITQVIKEKLNLRNEPMEFHSFGLAKEYCDGADKTHLIVLGENERFWVCCSSDAVKLFNNGYDYAF